MCNFPAVPFIAIVAFILLALQPPVDQAQHQNLGPCARVISKIEPNILKLKMETGETSMHPVSPFLYQEVSIFEKRYRYFLDVRC